MVRSRAAVDLERSCLCAGDAAQGPVCSTAGPRCQESITEPGLNTCVTAAQIPSQGEQKRIHQSSQVKPDQRSARFLQ